MIQRFGSTNAKIKYDNTKYTPDYYYYNIESNRTSDERNNYIEDIQKMSSIRVLWTNSALPKTSVQLNRSFFIIEVNFTRPVAPIANSKNSMNQNTNSFPYYLGGWTHNY
ncbi:hypothetical protein V1477_000131 [Vespula maculifrons]|uniref:Uncharacterized protein n=1 Tax=Vespula maculifrons TaxID=7453 RepID=A0ABD2D2P2_VESMC